MVESGKAWETVAVMVSNGRKALKDDSKRYGRVLTDLLDFRNPECTVYRLLFIHL